MIARFAHHSDGLFDHLSGSDEQGLRHGEADGLGGLEIDDELEFCRLLDRQVGLTLFK